MYAGVVVMAVAAAPVVAILYALHRIATVSPEPLHLLPFESGWIPAQHALSPYHVRWYLATLLFLAFDVEMLFMYHGSGELAERTLPGGFVPGAWSTSTAVVTAALSCCSAPVRGALWASLTA